MNTQDALPGLALLQAHAGQTVQLDTPAGTSLPAILQHARRGVAMNARYHCYSAEFLLAPDVQLPQAVYRLHLAGASWSLLMTPIGPTDGRRGRLQAVFHAMADEADAVEARDE